MTAVKVVFAVVLCSLVTAACGRVELTAARAAELLKASRDFTTRPASPVRRELVEVTRVRRIGRTSTEAEFSWRDVDPGPSGPASGPKTGMALFRWTEKGWVLASLFKVD
jgi:hypothetical protein